MFKFNSRNLVSKNEHESLRNLRKLMLNKCSFTCISWGIHDKDDCFELVEICKIVRSFPD